MNSSGGVVYHLRAFLNSPTRWEPFRKQLEHWLLTEWPPQNTQLLLVAPSGGYSLTKKFLCQYQNLCCIDPDPLASMIFKKRFGLKAHWSHKDYFNLTDPKKNHDFLHHLKEGLSSILSDYPQHDLLFCNFLGQIQNLLVESQLIQRDPKVGPEDWTLSWSTHLKQELTHRHWASYHDIVSFQTPQNNVKSQSHVVQQKTSLTLNSLIENFVNTSSLTQPLTAYDHQTWNLFSPTQDSTTPYWLWNIQNQTHHIIEGIHG